ncbi:MAG: hypothetical protein IID31_00665 [Planctomycetes bacterium]|nr:hypothetical protein [Planctomycetota bacterium]
MNKSTKAVLLSVLVFPGAGHFFLKKRVAGAILACASFTALYFIITNMVEMAMQIVEKIQRGEVAPDVATITELLSRQPVGNESQLDAAWAVLIICWVIALADSYRRGRAQDKSDLDR